MKKALIILSGVAIGSIVGYIIHEARHLPKINFDADPCWDEMEHGCDCGCEACGCEDCGTAGDI